KACVLPENPASYRVVRTKSYLFNKAPLSAKYKNIAGVEEKLTYTDTYAQENVTIDMEKVDFKALQGISGINVSAEDAKKGITMAQMELVMKAAGFKEVK
ncbi:DUF1307 domain-containing protein, partial [Escherichia coli]|uniref:DUF1307 domain-containing protein n=1 Tax=Escherichia coli TaxID=562 RepID=UPI0032DA937F